MRRWIRRWLSSLVVLGAFCLPLSAQAPPTPEAKEAVKDRGPPVPEFAIAFLVTALILTVVCMPSRKS